MCIKANRTLIGVFVIGAVLLATAAVIIFSGGRFFGEKRKIVMFFEGSVKGIEVGAPIVFRGVKIGQVTEVYIEANPDDLRTRIPVRGEIYPGSIRIWGEPADYKPDPEKSFPRLIAKGLRAELQVQSLVTGKLQINLDFFPNTEIRYMKRRKTGEYFEIPTVRSQFDRLRETLEELPIREVFGKISQSLDGIQNIINNPAVVATVQEMRAAVVDAFRDALVAAKPAIVKAQAAIENIRAISDNDSPDRHQINAMLKELSAAARAIRNWAEYLERHPEALLRGKGGPTRR